MEVLILYAVATGSFVAGLIVAVAFFIYAKREDR